MTRTTPEHNIPLHWTILHCIEQFWGALPWVYYCRRQPQTLSLHVQRLPLAPGWTVILTDVFTGLTTLQSGQCQHCKVSFSGEHQVLYCGVLFVCASVYCCTAYYTVQLSYPYRCLHGNKTVAARPCETLSSSCKWYKIQGWKKCLPNQNKFFFVLSTSNFTAIVSIWLTPPPPLVSNGK